MSAIHVQEMTRQMRNETRRILALPDHSWLTWAPAGTSNHMMWHAGHALWVMDLLGVALITGTSELPQHAGTPWAETFGNRCRPVSQTTRWPTREELDALLAKQMDRLVELLGMLPDDRLGIIPPEGKKRSMIGNLIHGLHDEAKHHGEMYLIYKLRRAAG